MSEPNSSAPTEVLFYHLEQQTLEKVLPTLVEKTLERGWRAVVQAGSHERLAAIDLALWTFKEDSFLAHGTAKDGHAAEQPVYLTTTGETPNGAGVRFLVDGAEAEAFSGFVRIVYMFDGNEAEAVTGGALPVDGGEKRRLPGDLLAAERYGQMGAQGLSCPVGGGQKKAPRGSAGFKASGGDGVGS